MRGRAGFVHAAVVINAFADRIVGWCVASRADAGLVLDALEPAIHDRDRRERLAAYREPGSQYLSLPHNERLAQAGIAASVGSKHNCYDNARTETIIGLCKAEAIHDVGAWRGAAGVEVATLNWVHWFNKHRLLEPLGYMPPSECEQAYHQRQVAA